MTTNNPTKKTPDQSLDEIVLHTKLIILYLVLLFLSSFFVYKWSMIDDKVGDWYSKPPMIMGAPPGLGVLGGFVMIIMIHVIWILSPILLPVVLVSLILYSVWEIMNNLVDVLREIIKANKVELTRTASIRLIAVFIAYATILKVYMAEVAKKNEKQEQQNLNIRQRC